MLLLLFAGMQLGLVPAVRPAYARHIEWLVTISILAFVSLVAGHLPIPFELLKQRGRLVGVDFVFPRSTGVVPSSA